MKKARILQVLVAAVLGLTMPLCRADMANGTYSIPLGSTLPLWDISGKYYFSSLIPWDELPAGIAKVGAGNGYSLSIDPSGKFSGADKLYYDDGLGNVLNGNISVNGMVKDSRVTMKVALDGTLIVASGLLLNLDFGAKAVITLTVDGSGHRLIVKNGSARLTAKDYNNNGKKRSKTLHIPANTLLTLPINVTGEWSMNLNLVPNGNTYTASATILTSTGATTSMTGVGIYRTKTGDSKILLKCPGSTLNMIIRTSGTNANVQSIKGKLYGQTIKL